MAKFKTGDKIKRVTNGVHWCPLGYEAVVGGSYTYTDVYGGTVQVNDSHWELVGGKHHKHHDLIIQWAKGAEIQYYSPDFEMWLSHDGLNPRWLNDMKYRVKPKSLKTDKERIAELEARVAELEAKDDKN